MARFTGFFAIGACAFLLGAAGETRLVDWQRFIGDAAARAERQPEDLTSSGASRAGEGASERATGGGSQAQAPDRPTPMRTATEPSRKVVVVAGGDVNLGRHVGQRLLADPDYAPLAGVAPVLQSGDLVLLNLESPLSHQAGQTRHPTERNAFTGPPSGADALALAGVDVVSVANNHAWDYGFEGFLQTLDHLAVAGVRAAGGSSERGAAYEAAVFRRNGVSIAVLAATDVWNPGNLQTHEGGPHVADARSDAFTDAVARASGRFDVVVASVHAGREYAPIPERDDRLLLQGVARAGATVVLGHHPHVVQGVSWVEHRPVLHSLGNLVFGVHRDHPWAGRSYLARMTIQASNADLDADLAAPRVELELCPVVILHDEPYLLDAAGLSLQAELHRRRIEELSAPLGGVEVDPAGADRCFAVAPSEPEIEPKLFAAAADDHRGVDQTEPAN